MSKLVYCQMETNHHNPDGVAWYAYFDGPCDLEQVRQAVGDEGDERVGGGPLSCVVVEKPEPERPNPLSKHAGLRRFYIGHAE